ncbi:MAG: recombinase family protein [Acidobacteriia bacterium]|nr:recombinase family protein [Terriglobia bacterium]
MKSSFVSLRDNLDLTIPAGRLMYQVVGALAEFERCPIAERVKAGIENAQSKSVRIDLRHPRNLWIKQWPNVSERPEFLSDPRMWNDPEIIGRAGRRDGLLCGQQSHSPVPRKTKVQMESSLNFQL